jgi:hypothetical protein
LNVFAATEHLFIHKKNKGIVETARMYTGEIQYKPKLGEWTQHLHSRMGEKHRQNSGWQT